MDDITEQETNAGLQCQQNVKMRMLRFAFCTPSPSDGKYVYLMTTLATKLTARQNAKIYCHCELFFEDDMCFGITSLGLHFERRSLSRENYVYYAIHVPDTNYNTLYKYCQRIWETKAISFSALKSVCTRLPLVSILFHLVWPKRYSYCSELLIRCLHKAGIFTDIPTRGVSPNDIADRLVYLYINNKAFIPLGPKLGYSTRAEHTV